ncbi:hypothetical protein, partial [Stenotrophomonas maltophilia]|uniref:hypothetical protein n=1 Tax=Stenotrophomonas maltophilia TaxID=40324 RepID=UPI0034E27459
REVRPTKTNHQKRKITPKIKKKPQRIKYPPPKQTNPPNPPPPDTQNKKKKKKPQKNQKKNGIKPQGVFNTKNLNI